MNNGIKLNIILKYRKKWQTLQKCKANSKRHHLDTEKWGVVARFTCLLRFLKCFSKWQQHDIFNKIFEELMLDCDLKEVSIDSTIVKVHQDTGSASRTQSKRNHY